MNNELPCLCLICVITVTHSLLYATLLAFFQYLSGHKKAQGMLLFRCSKKLWTHKDCFIFTCIDAIITVIETKGKKDCLMLTHCHIRASGIGLVGPAMAGPTDIHGLD